MAEQRVGTCSLCGGEVRGWRGGWWSVEPPPPDSCSSCGAHRREEVIDMVKVGDELQRFSTTSPRDFSIKNS